MARRDGKLRQSWDTLKICYRSLVTFTTTGIPYCFKEYENISLDALSTPRGPIFNKNLFMTYWTYFRLYIIDSWGNEIDFPRGSNNGREKCIGLFADRIYLLRLTRKLRRSMGLGAQRFVGPSRKWDRCMHQRVWSRGTEASAALVFRPSQ